MHIERPEIVVFLGPSLPLAEARQLLDAVYLPPVQQGSVYAVARSRPRAIVLIDGYFGWVPSVWHKEILWALQQGIAVFGAASMGALRAAELHPFGMIGHGRVFRDFAEGRLEDDDEVAVVHADAGTGFRPLSAAMVNLRYTLQAAERRGVVSPTSAAALVGYFKSRFFADRRLQGLRAQVGPLSLLPEDELGRLEAWLPDHYRDVKREDAESLLRGLAAGELLDRRPEPDGFIFHSTVNWQQLTETVRSQAPALPPGGVRSPNPAEIAVDDVLAECRLAGAWPEVEARALALLLAAGSPASGETVTEEEHLTELARLCLSRGLEDLDAVSCWLRSQGWESGRLARLVDREALLRRARDYWSCDLQEIAREVLVLSGRYERLSERAREKQRWLDAIGGREEMFAGDAGEALAWFRDRLGSPASEPDELLAQRHGWASLSDMREEIVCEYGFSRAMGQPPLPHQSG